MSFLSSLKLPLAAKWQESTIPFDWSLTERARLIHPTCVWWWGARAIDGTFGAWCYLCERHVTTWHRAFPITQGAITAILTHRDLHLMGRIQTPGSDTVGVSPTVEASTNGGNEP